MQPTSAEGIRRQIQRKQKAGKLVPQRMIDALAEAIKRNPEKAHLTKGIDGKLIKPSRKNKIYKVLHGTKLGKASKGRTISGDELERRKKELEKLCDIPAY
jgi:hypothetical protein